MLKEKIEQLSKAYFESYRSVRHHLHAHPELSYKEFNTSTFIQQHLNDLNIPYQVMAETGVVALVEGKKSDRVIALRADIDALPIQEENNIPYASTVPGVMHACGHDVHTSILLGAAKILNETRGDWEGTVKLIFQPGEEKNPGGASIMIKEGVLENPAPRAIVGLHVHPILETGKLSFIAGKSMASADEIYITVKGKGGHAATPHLTADTVLTASELVVALQQVVSRDRNPFSPSVLSICAINGGFTTNVIPSEVKLMGTFRAMDEKWRFDAHKRIQEVLDGVAKSTGAEIELKIDVGYPTVYNDPMITERARSIASETFGTSNV
ncbi:MAG: amidohydrolase, partial [Chitinophagia bacterium]|nr:amidohydrolase [Chitinophagia bacterium]